MAVVPADDLIFLDQISNQIRLTWRRGRTPRGGGLTEAVPRNHGDNLTLLTVIGTDGVKAPLFFPTCSVATTSPSGSRSGWSQPCDPARSWCRTTSRCTRTRARTAIEAARCRPEFLRVYSPDDHPIELVFAALKGHLGGAKTRTAEAVIDAIGVGLDQATPDQVRNCYRHCVYSTTASGQPQCP